MSDQPVRVQLRRIKGWRLPPNTLSVARPTKWGNPFVVGKPHPYCRPDEIAEGHACASPMTREEAVEAFTALYWSPEELAELRGKNLACWCGPGPCHADVLLELANRPTGPRHAAHAQQLSDMGSEYE